MSKPEHRALVSALSSLKWSDVKLMAIHLPRMDFTTLNMIEEGHPTEPKLWVVYAMDEWLQRDTEASWAKVVSALREINKNALATEIEKDYSMTTPHLLEPTPLSSNSASLPTLSAATASVPSLEHIAISSQDEETCGPLDEIQGMKNKAAMLRTKFTSVLIHTKICFMDKEEESRKFLRDFQVTLTSLPLFKQYEDMDFLKSEKNRIKKAKNVDEIFDILDPYWSYVDYDLLEHIIKRFGTSDLQEEMRKYVTELEQFEKETTVHDFSLAIQEEVVIPARYGKLAVKLKNDSKMFTLHDVRQFKKSLEGELSLKEYTLLFRGRSSNSVKIILAFPPEVHAKLLEVFKDKQFRKKHKVASEEFNSECTDVSQSSRVEVCTDVRRSSRVKGVMSDNVDTNSIVYRALVASVANELTSKEIYQVAYVWLKGNGDISKYSPSEKTCGLELFACLECLGLFSSKNTDGLLEILKSINRNDLAKKIETYKKKQKKGENIYETKCTKKRDSTRSKERQHLEQTFEVMVTQMAFLEQQLSLLQSTLQENLLDEGMVIVQHSGAIMQQLATNLATVQEKFASHRSSKRSSRRTASSKKSDQNSSKFFYIDITAALDITGNNATMNVLVLQDRCVIDSLAAVHHPGGITYIGSPPALGLEIHVCMCIMAYFFMSLFMHACVKSMSSNI